MRDSVILTRPTIKKPNGRKYPYWVLRWYGSDGKRRTKSLGRADRMSKRQAEKLRRQKQTEIGGQPGRRDLNRAPLLGEFLERYFRARKTELSPGTLQLHRQTGRYLRGFFGANRRLDVVRRADARAFKTALAAGDLTFVNKRKRILAEATVNLNVRNARKIFTTAMDDDLIPFNPFDRIAGTPPPPKGWHEVTPDEFGKLVACARPA